MQLIAKPQRGNRLTRGRRQLWRCWSGGAAGLPDRRATRPATLSVIADLSEADVQCEMSEPDMENAATGPMHDEGEKDDRQNGDDHPEEKHDDSGDGTPGYGSRSGHGRQLPAAIQLTH
jgi:hypothetical protein